MSSASTQKKVILEHLQKHKSITTLEAIVKYHIVRPTNRIQELKEEGFNIGTEIIYKTRDDGSTTHYAKYTLLGA